MSDEETLNARVMDGWNLDRDSDTPAYAQIAARLAELIDGGALATGDRVPSERELAEWVGVSRMTARAALQALSEQGVVARGAGRGGSQVAEPPVDHDLTAFAGFTEMVLRQGMHATAEVLSAETLEAPKDVASQLRIEPGDPVHRIERVRAGDGEPLTLEDSWFPAACFPDLLENDLTASIYDLMAAADLRPCRATERLSPVLADHEQARILKTAPGAPLMCVERVAFAADGTPVELAFDVHRGDRARFVVHVSTAVPR
jgi:GntR family transcriptional regulator